MSNKIKRLKKKLRKAKAENADLKKALDQAQLDFFIGGFKNFESKEAHDARVEKYRTNINYGGRDYSKLWAQAAREALGVKELPKVELKKPDEKIIMDRTPRPKSC